MRKSVRFFLVLMVFSLAGCVTPKPGVDVTRFGLDDAVIAADLGVFPQDLTVYADRAGRDVVLMALSRQGREDARFDQRFFAAWDAGVPLLPKGDAFEGARNMDPVRGFAENLRLWSSDRWQKIVSNASEETYGLVPARPAITVTSVHLRRLPTDAPYFLDPGRGGEGFPFDYMQNSALWVGTPVAVTHVSRDGQWAFVQTSLASGWTRVANLAVVDEEFIKTWRARPMATIIQDDTIIAVTNAQTDAVTRTRPTVMAQTGAVLPFAAVIGQSEGANSPHVSLYVPIRQADGKAAMVIALSPMHATRQKPMRLTPGNIALVGNALVGQPYGWGGMFGQRDCSAAMHDLFVPFGIWMPRNSSLQGRMGTRLDLEGLAPDAKEDTIIREGTPFFSLVSMRGHVGLYLGAYPMAGGKGDVREVPVMFHNIWGVRVVSGAGETRREGRGVIGKAVVTSLRPGAEHPDISSPASILDRIAGLAILPGE